ERVDLGQVLESVLETMKPELAAKEHQLELELPEEPLVLHADAVRLAQVFGNLLANATKYTPPGGHIEIRVRKELPNGAVVVIKDNGEGIAPRDLARIFELFVQLGDAGKGLGIGLALVAR